MSYTRPPRLEPEYRRGGIRPRSPSEIRSGVRGGPSGAGRTDARADANGPSRDYPTPD